MKKDFLLINMVVILICLFFVRTDVFAQTTQVDIWLTDENGVTYHKGKSTGTVTGTTPVDGNSTNSNNSGLTSYDDEDVPKVTCEKKDDKGSVTSCTKDVKLVVDQNYQGKQGQRVSCYRYEDPTSHDSDKVCTVRVYTQKVEITSGPSTSYTGQHHNYQCKATFYDGKTRMVNERNEKFVWLSYPSGTDMKTEQRGRYIGSTWAGKQGYTDPRGNNHPPDSLHDFYPADPQNRAYNVNCTYYPGYDFVAQYYANQSGITSWVKRSYTGTNDTNEFSISFPTIAKAKKFMITGGSLWVDPQDHGGYDVVISIHDADTNQWIQIYNLTYTKDTSLAGLVAEFASTVGIRNVDGVKFDSNRDVNFNYHDAQGTEVSFFVQSTVTPQTLKDWDRITYFNDWISDYDLENNKTSSWHVPKNAKMTVNNKGISKLDVTVNGDFQSAINKYTNKTLSPTSSTSSTTPGKWNQETFITGHWYDFRAQVTYTDNTTRDITSAEEVYWDSSPWFKGQSKFKVENPYDSGMSYTGLDHRIPADGKNIIDVEYFHRNVPYGTPSYNKTKQTNELNAHQMKKLEIKGSSGYSAAPITTINKNDSKTVQYTAWVTWTDGKQENWTNSVLWKGDHLTTTPGKFDFSKLEGLNQKASIYAQFEDIDNLIGSATRVTNNSGATATTGWDSNLSLWDGNYDKKEITINNCDNVTHLAWQCATPSNYWKTNPTTGFDAINSYNGKKNVNFSPKPSEYGYSSWTETNDLYTFKKAFDVSGTSTGVGNE